MLRNRRHTPGFLGATSFVLFTGILAVCLWPFYAPGNTASWLAHGHGITFGPHGILLASQPLHVPGKPTAASSSIELWLQPDPLHNMGEIFTVHATGSSRQFTIDQWCNGLTLRTVSVSDPIRTSGDLSYTDAVFTSAKSVFITITSGGHGTTVYIDGISRTVTPAFRITNELLSGKLVIGAAARVDDSWPGRFRGLAIYSRVLSPTQVRQHYVSWMATGRPDIHDPDGVLALYLFDEGAGRRVHSKIHGATDLYMPERYLIPAKRVLSPPSFAHPEDIIANILGFLPLGYTLCGYLTSSRRSRIAIAATMLICAGFSLFVESLQTFLPTRDSSMTDVITNLLGGTIGAFLYRWDAQAFTLNTPVEASLEKQAGSV